MFVTCHQLLQTLECLYSYLFCLTLKIMISVCVCMCMFVHVTVDCVYVSAYVCRVHVPVCGEQRWI